MRLYEEYVLRHFEQGRRKIKRAIFFRHGKSRADFAVQKRVKPFLLLHRRTIPSQDLCNMDVSENQVS